MESAGNALRGSVDKTLSVSKKQEADLNARALENADFVQKFGNRVNLGSVVPLIETQQ